MSSKTIIELDNLRKEIERMNKFHQVEVLKILKASNFITLNENNYGTFINMKDIPDDLINKILSYIEYVSEQEINLKKIEEEKNSIKNTYFDNKTSSNSISHFIN
tara:strand:+ start:147 stop:461 length:315 start_codon:yes stop_codon:yes gene_type:complete